MRRPIVPSLVSPPAIALSLLVALGVVAPPAAHARKLVGTTAAVTVRSPHPYPNGDASLPVVWSHTLQHPGASFVKLRLARLALGPGDTLAIRDGAGRAVVSYTERDNRRGFWAPAIEGDTAVLELRADAQGTGDGVVIDRYGYGETPLFIESICAGDQREDVACYAATPIETASRAVGRMLFEDGGSFFACTGFLVSPLSHFMSNEHCISTQASVDSLEVRFNYQRSTCGGPDLASFQTFTGDRLVMANAAYDVALMTLSGNPAATYGFLPLVGRTLALGEPLYLPGHPGGDPKVVSVSGCSVTDPVTDGDVADSDFGHRCDTEGGSSGSPVLDAAHQVVGLHHFGGCNAVIDNQGVLMSRILPLLPASGSSLDVSTGTIMLGTKPGKDTLTLRGTLALGLSTDGVEPLTEPVTLTLSDTDGVVYTATIPGGAFRKAGKLFRFTDRGVVANGLRSMTLHMVSGQVRFTLSGRDLTLLAADRETLTVTLQIGNDVASETLNVLRRVRKLTLVEQPASPPGGER